MYYIKEYEYEAISIGHNLYFKEIWYPKEDQRNIFNMFNSTLCNVIFILFLKKVSK